MSDVMDRADVVRERRPTLQRAHFIGGIVLFVVFVLSGQYLRFFTPLRHTKEAATHLLYRSRHIYILGVALVHLAFGAYLTRARSRVVARLQTAGSVLLFVAAALTVSAFLIEKPPHFEGSAYTYFGLFALLGGTLVHVIASRLE